MPKNEGFLNDLSTTWFVKFPILVLVLLIGIILVTFVLITKIIYLLFTFPFYIRSYWLHWKVIGMNFMDRVFFYNKFSPSNESEKICVVGHLDRIISRDDCLERMQTLKSLERFMSVPRTEPVTGRMYFDRIRDQDLDFDSMLHEHSCQPNSWSKKFEEISRMEFEANKPMWDLHLIQSSKTDGVEDEGKNEEERYGCRFGKSTIVLRIDHCIGDGVTLSAALMQHMFTSEKGDPAIDASQLFRRRPKIPSSNQGSYFFSMMDVLTNLTHSLWSAIFELNKDGTVPGFSGWNYSGKQSYHTFSTRIDRIKRIKNHFGCTVTDVLNACVAGALRNFAISESGTSPSELKDRDCHGMMTVALTTPKELLQGPKNTIGTTKVPLPCHIDKSVDRLQATIEGMKSLKRSYTLMVSLKVFQLVEWISRAAIKPAATSAFEKSALIVSSVRGPDDFVYFRDAKIGEISVFITGAPMFLIEMIGYAGKLYWCMMSDIDNAKDQEKLEKYLEDEIESLLRQSRKVSF